MLMHISKNMEEEMGSGLQWLTFHIMLQSSYKSPWNYIDVEVNWDLTYTYYKGKKPKINY